MTEKEKESRGGNNKQTQQRSLSSCSMSGSASGVATIEKGAPAMQHGASKTEQHYQIHLKSPVDNHRVQASGVVLTPLGNENLNGAGRTGAIPNYGSLFTGREHQPHHHHLHHGQHQTM